MTKWYIGILKINMAEETRNDFRLKKLMKKKIIFQMKQSIMI